jgi:sec-independent protein translocase protein TatA
MPQIGPLEVLLVGVIALIVFGPQRLPEIARSVGKALAEFKRQASDMRAEFESGMNDDEGPEDEKPASISEPPPAEDTPAETPPPQLDDE